MSTPPPEGGPSSPGEDPPANEQGPQPDSPQANPQPNPEAASGSGGGRSPLGIALLVIVLVIVVVGVYIVFFRSDQEMARCSAAQQAALDAISQGLKEEQKAGGELALRNGQVVRNRADANVDLYFISAEVYRKGTGETLDIYPVWVATSPDLTGTPKVFAANQPAVDVSTYEDVRDPEILRKLTLEDVRIDEASAAAAAQCASDLAS